MTKTFGDLKVGDKVWIYDGRAVMELEVTRIQKDLPIANFNIYALEGYKSVNLPINSSHLNTITGSYYANKETLVEHLKTKRNILNSLIEEYEHKF